MARSEGGFIPMTPYYTDSAVTLLAGKSENVLPELEAESFDSCVCDPPYELGFMGKKWDNSGIAYSVDFWREVLRVLKPGAHLLAFGGTRTNHRMVCAIEDAGFEIRDSLQWLYGSGFPKSLDVSKAIDREAGAERKIVGRYEHPDGNPRNWDEHESNGKSSTTNFKAPRTGESRNITAPSSDSAKQW